MVTGDYIENYKEYGFRNFLGSLFKDYSALGSILGSPGEPFLAVTSLCPLLTWRAPC